MEEVRSFWQWTYIKSPIWSAICGGREILRPSTGILHGGGMSSHNPYQSEIFNHMWFESTPGRRRKTMFPITLCMSAQNATMWKLGLATLACGWEMKLSLHNGREFQPSWSNISKRSEADRLPFAVARNMIAWCSHYQHKKIHQSTCLFPVQSCCA